MKTTWDDEEDVLSRGEGFSPAAVESDEDKHEALGVEGGPAEEEGEDDNNLNITLNLLLILECLTQHADDRPLPLYVGPEKWKQLVATTQSS